MLLNYCPFRFLCDSSPTGLEGERDCNMKVIINTFTLLIMYGLNKESLDIDKVRRMSHS